METKFVEVQVGDFVFVLNGKLEVDGLKKGALLYLAGSTIAKCVENDPYMLRKFFVAASVVEGHIQADGKPFLIDGLDVQPVSEAEKELLMKHYEADFTTPEGPKEVVVE